MADKEKRFGCRMSRCLILLVMMLTVASSSLFAATGDFGFSEYFQVIIDWMTAIGGILILLSLCIWGVKAIVMRDITPRDWKAIAVIGIGGIILVLGPQIVSGIFGSDLGNVG